jgi:ABC-type transporter Mla maintaining outer membrane lipid asymmetry permease subunit MlaE
MSWLRYVAGTSVVLAAFFMWLHHYINEPDDMKRQNIMAVGVGSLCLLVVVAVYCGTITATLLALTLTRADPRA